MVRLISIAIPVWLIQISVVVYGAYGWYDPQIVFTLTCNRDSVPSTHLLCTVQRSIAVCYRRDCDPSVLIAVRGAWVSHVPPSNLFLRAVFIGWGGRLRRSVTTIVMNVPCLSRRCPVSYGSFVADCTDCCTQPVLRVLVYLNSFRDGRTTVDRPTLPMYESWLIIVRRNVMSGTICPRWQYHPPIIWKLYNMLSRPFMSPVSTVFPDTKRMSSSPIQPVC